MSGELTIDLGAITRNYETLDKRSAPSCETACVVKADAYGLGADKCAPALYEAGARSFFVATSDEAKALRKILPQDADIYDLSGLTSDERAQQYKKLGIIPVLNFISGIKRAKEFGDGFPVALHFDTGMNRLGIGEQETEELFDDLSLLEGLNVRLIMTHFASSEVADSPDNLTQLKRFKKIMERIKPLCPEARYSICNSGGLFLGTEYHLDMVRVGIALYGGHPTSSLLQNPMEPCVELKVPVLQVRSARKGEFAGYNSTYRFEGNTTLAVCAIGYADGLPRTLSNKGVIYWKHYPLPIRGRVSMDSVICDLKPIAMDEYVMPGDDVEVIGTHQTIDQLARDAGTISYDILTSLGNRYRRVYR